MKKIYFCSSLDHEASSAKETFIDQYGQADLTDADCIVCLGGDGFLLETLHAIMEYNIPVFGINYGTIGFLMNKRTEGALLERLENAHPVTISPLRMRAKTVEGEVVDAIGFNDIFLFRQNHQTIRMSVKVDGKDRLEELVGDGIILATPTGSTAYNRSVQGPILPLGANLLALTPISAVRPIHWRGALLPMNSHVLFKLDASEKRAAAAVADFKEVRNVTEVSAYLDNSITVTLLFDPDSHLAERIVKEQFDG